MRFNAVVVAAGAGTRAGGPAPKQWRLLQGEPVALWSVRALLAAGAETVAVVVRPQDQALAQPLARVPGVRLVIGGDQRFDSVRAGLQALEGLGVEAVLIHDAARPLLSTSHVRALLSALGATAAGALLALPVSDTLKQAGFDGLVGGTVPRAGLWRAQTPQAFRFDEIVAAYEAWPADQTATDDAAVLEHAGGRVLVVPGDPILFKLTYPEDFDMVERLAGAVREVRTGQGFDVHRFGPGDRLWLCGVEIAHTQGLVGHSDADAGLHALTDALLGAIAAGDIGDHFPPSDPQWRGVSSDRFLTHALGLLQARGGRVLNADVTLICERPKVKPFREAMRARLAALLEIDLDRVSVKATTTEALGFTGREEGLAAQAVTTIELPA